MKLFKWLGERYDAGPVGSSNGPSYRPRIRTKGGIVLRALIALVMLAPIIWFMTTSRWTMPPLTIVLVVAAIVGYSVLGYYVRPRTHPMMHPMVGGWIENFSILLFPGQFLADATVDLVRLLRRSRWQV